MQNFTADDLLFYLYNEMEGTKPGVLYSELQENWALNEKYMVLKEMIERLSKMSLLKPRKQSVDAILNYASTINTVTSI